MVKVTLTNSRGEAQEAFSRSDFVGQKVRQACDLLNTGHYPEPRQPISVNGVKVPRTSARILQAGDTFRVNQSLGE